MLDWRRFDPGSFERAAQMLVRDAFGATSVDGAGGDEAQDLRWESPDGLVIFEVKSFCDRLRSAQKRQIEASLNRAVAHHHPARWALVLPLNPSPAELTWFDTLRKRFPDVELEWLGIDWLDAQVSGRENLISYLEGPDYKLLRRARQLELEHAAAATGDEVSARMAQLAARGEEISPYWALDVHTTADGQVRVLRAKREESAALDPIVLRTRFSFPTGDPDAAETAQNVDQVLRFGGDVTIAGQFIDGFAVEASSEATRRLVGHGDQLLDSLRVVSVPDTAGLPFTARLVLVYPRTGPERGSGAAPDHRGPAQLGPEVDVQFTHRLQGTSGMTLHGQDHAAVLRIALRRGLTGEGALAPDGSIHLALSRLAGRRPDEVLPALRLLAALQVGAEVALHVGPASLASFAVDGPWGTPLSRLLQLTEAIDAIATHTQTVIRLPESDLPRHQVDELIAVGDAITKGNGQLPSPAVTVTVRPGRLAGFLNAIGPDGAGGLYFARDHEVSLGGRSYTVSGLAVSCPRPRLLNRAGLLQKAAAGEDDGTREWTVEIEADPTLGLRLIRAVDVPAVNPEPPAGDPPAVVRGSSSRNG